MIEMLSSTNDTFMLERQHRNKKPSHKRSPDSLYAVASFVRLLGTTEFEDEAIFLKTDACTRPAFQLIVDKTPDTFFEEARFPPLQKALSFPCEERTSRTRPVLPVRRGKAATVSSSAGVGEEELQLRRKSITLSLQKLYDERKESILELFEQSWVVSDNLEDEIVAVEVSTKIAPRAA
jgi:hypothetical protein